jgi:hypothetical protein
MIDSNNKLNQYLAMHHSISHITARNMAVRIMAVRLHWKRTLWPVVYT